VPRVVRLANTEIAMYFADHNPPHFHILGRDGAAQVAIETLEVLAVSGRVDVREALDWASRNQSRLRELWTEFSGGAA
jgi:hypothetical protein